MKSFLFLVFFFAGSDCAFYDVHTDSQVNGCSDIDGEAVNSLDGEDMWVADFDNKRGVEPQPSFVDHISYPKDFFENAYGNLQTCRYNLNVTRNALKDQPPEFDAPALPVIYPRDQEALGEKNTLVCHVSGFFPAPVKVHWTKNGVRVAGPGRGASSAIPDKDGFFRQTFRLDFTPAEGDTYSCVVEHVALDQGLATFWTVNVDQPGIGPTVFCALGLTVGLFGVATGTFLFVKGNQYGQF